MKSKTRLQKEHLQNYETFAIFSLTMDKKLSTNMRFPKYSLFELNFQNYKKSHQGNFEGLANYFQMNKHHAKNFYKKKWRN